MEPHVVHSLIDPVTKKRQMLSGDSRKFYFNKNLDTVRHGMRDCVTSGSCQRLASLPFAVAGKTGTRNGTVKTQSRMVHFFRAFNSPEIVVTILVEEGAKVAPSPTPIAYEFTNGGARQAP